MPSNVCYSENGFLTPQADTSGFSLLRGGSIDWAFDNTITPPEEYHESTQNIQDAYAGLLGKIYGLEFSVKIQWEFLPFFFVTLIMRFLTNHPYLANCSFVQVVYRDKKS